MQNPNARFFRPSATPRSVKLQQKAMEVLAVMEDIEEIEEQELEPEAPKEKRAAKEPASFDRSGDINLNIYFRNISKIPLLKREEEVDIAKKMEQGRKRKNLNQIEDARA